MAKFKVGDKVRVREDLKTEKRYGEWVFSKGMKIYKGRVFEIEYVRYDSYALKGTPYGWTDEMLEEVKEEVKMEKTVLEIINDGYTGRKYIHECGTIVYVDCENILRFDYHQLDKKPEDDKASGRVVVLDMKLKEYRKEYTFEEAFKAYEEGKEIESVYSGYRYKKENGEDVAILSADWQDFDYFELYEIRGKWYIND